MGEGVDRLPRGAAVSAVRVVIDFPHWPPQIATAVGQTWDRGRRLIYVWVYGWSGEADPQEFWADEVEFDASGYIDDRDWDDR